MPRKKRLKYHYLYKTTNLINGEYYIGVHSTYNIKDGYLGSGTRLWNSIRKYGKENFVKQELEFFETRNEVLDREKEFVNKKLLSDNLCINLKEGGAGGLSSKEHREKFSRAGAEAALKSGKNQKRLIELKSDRDSDWFKTFSKNLSESLKGNTNFFGKKHREETKKRIGIKNSIKQKGSRNSQYGLVWITNGIENRKVKKRELKSWLKNDVWKKGRVF